MQYFNLNNAVKRIIKARIKLLTWVVYAEVYRHLYTVYDHVIAILTKLHVLVRVRTLSPVCHLWNGI